MNVEDVELDLFLVDGDGDLWMFKADDRTKVRDVYLDDDGVQYHGDEWWNLSEIGDHVTGFVRPANREDLEMDLAGTRKLRAQGLM